MHEFRPGPSMRRLTEKQRAFVEHYVASGQRNATASAIAAGYSDTNPIAPRVTGHRLLNDAKIGDAIKELVGQQFTSLAPMALSNIAAIAADREHRSCLDAARFICEVIGFSPTKRIEIEGHMEVSLPELRARALELMAELGTDPTVIEALPAPTEEPIDYAESEPETEDAV